MLSATRICMYGLLGDAGTHIRIRMRQERTQRQRALCADFSLQVRFVGGLKRERPSQHRVQADAEAPHVHCTTVIWFAAVQLRWHLEREGERGRQEEREGQHDSTHAVTKPMSSDAYSCDDSAVHELLFTKS